MPLVTDYVHPYPGNVDYGRQGVAVEGTKKPGQTAHYQNGIWGLTRSTNPPPLDTVDKIFLTGLKAGRNQNFLGHRPQISSNPPKFAKYYSWLTYGQVDDRRRNLGSGLVHLFKNGTLGGGEFETVGIWSPNRPEWQIIDIACASYDKVAVSLYDTLGPEAVEYIIGHSHLSIVFTTSDHVSTMLKLAPKHKCLKMIVSIDNLQPDAKKVFDDWAKAAGVQLKELREIEEIGAANLIQPIPAHPEQVLSICYTSGTTSNPKGVLLRHRNMATAATSQMYGFDAIPGDAALLSYLPLAHIYGRLCELVSIITGGRIGYWTGDPVRLLEDAQILKPQYFPSVPRVLNRIYHAAMVAAKDPGLKGALFRRAMEVKMDRFKTTGEVTHMFWDKLVFRKIQAVLGGNIMLIVCGSAPLNKDVMDFLKIAFGCIVLEGWGMTETCASGLKNFPDDPTSSGNVGPPTPGTEIKLIDVPSMNYTSEDKPMARGELCIRGDICFTTYYKDPKSTSEAVDAEGWIHTGDVASVDSAGRFKIIDRVKNIMKLAQGEYVALEKIENTYAACPIAAQVFVYGNSLQSFLLGVIVPDPIQFATLVSKVTGQQVSGEDISTLTMLCADEKVNAQVLRMLTKEASKNGLKGFEKIKRIHLSMQPFSVEENTMTPTLKLRRKDAYNKFQKELDALYALGDRDVSKL